MPRNRYTREVRTFERKRHTQQEDELAAIDRQLRSRVPAPLEVPLLNEDKTRRSTRLEQKRRRKAKRREGSTSNVDKK